MAGNTVATVQSNQTFYLPAAAIAVGVLNPANDPNGVWDCGVGMNYCVVTTIVTGSPASFTVLIEGTVDGSNWNTVLTTTAVAGETRFSASGVHFANLRARCTAVSGGSSPTIAMAVTAMQQAPISTTAGTAGAVQDVIIQSTAGTTVNVDSDTALHVSDGIQNPKVILNAATTGVAGTAADFGSSVETMTFQVHVTGTPTGGTVTFLGSQDGSQYVTLTNASVFGGTAGTITAGVLNANATTDCLISPGAAGNNLVCCRYFRADSTTLTGGSSPTVTVKAMGF